MKWPVLVFISGFLFFGSANVAAVSAQQPGVTSQDYRNLIEKYRLQQDQFSIASSSYYSLKTFAAQEEAVQSGRDLFLTRANVLISYYLGLSETLIAQSTLNQANKEALNAQLVSVLEKLGQHRARVDIATDRVRLAQETAWMKTEEKELLLISDRASALIRIGQLQNAFNQLKDVRNHIQAVIQASPMSETKRVEKFRGIEEIDRNLVSAESQLAQANLLYTDSVTRSSNAGVNNQVSDQLSGAFIKMLASISFALELASDV
ncbi:hypothetical protein KBD71_02800 [Candidatus Woesebacteria bacterium]|nr:hypothetical protein [Candidatus Woesebacteria bacterium]